MHGLGRPFMGSFLALAAVAGASAAAQPAVLLDSQTVMARIEERNPSLQTYQARVHVNVHMQSFPWLSPNLDGTAYFKRPDNYEVVFDRVPPYAHGINKLFGDIGDPIAWQRDSNVTLQGLQTIEGRPELTLRLTKKIHSDQLSDTLAYVDPASYQVVRMDFHYVNGGTISMTQHYKDQGQYNVIASQHAEIHIPHVRAVADATFATYQANIAVDDSVFTRK